MDLRATLNLPDPNFTIPMKAGLTQLEPELQQRWEEMRVYHRIQDSRRDSDTFILHDGPPYTNSPIHIGTALNKILKDFTVKSRTMMGYRAPYVPGFDNHGLPIEQAVMKEFQERKEQPDIVTLRKACREHAQKYLDVQRGQFQRLGVFGLWELPYATMDFGFEAEILRVFRRLVEGGYIYRGLRPTLWSPTSRTALADTEIVYQDHVSKSIYVEFALKHDPNRIFEQWPGLKTVIWTTTPWTIPSNLAIAFHPELDYSIVRVAGREGHYAVAAAMLEQVVAKLGWTAEVVATISGVNFDHAVFAHPIYGRDSLGVMADYVTTEDGTGVVHTAPSHGRDDFYTGLKYGLPIPNTVDERGVLTRETGEFEGVHYKQCDTVVVDRLREVGALLHVEDYHHSYPYAERDGQPVIFRATEQWFVGIDHDQLRRRMLEQTDQVEWFPESSKNRIQAMIANRPDWCISRQRPWGVGIPIFYGKDSREPVLDPDAIDRVIQLVMEEGSDAWFVREPHEILGADYRHPVTGETEFVKETDVLDVWFDSGSTSLAVLEGNVYEEWEESWPADLYLEGSDQHRGWFNSSLVIGTAVMDQAPYRQVLTHGFVTDDQGRKMSKRLGNVVDPLEACEQFGADVVRYWVASVNYENDVPCSNDLLKKFGEHYRDVRNTLRFLLGNLYDYDPSVEPKHLLDLDEWVIEQTDLLVSACVSSYRDYRFGEVINDVHNFCVRELSRFYLDAIKDRMYCDGKDWPSRRSGQYACWYVLIRLVKLLAPILPHTAEEVYARIPFGDRPRLESVHMETFDDPDADRLEAIVASDFQARFASLMSIRSDMFAEFEKWKASSGVKDSQDVIATIRASSEEIAMLRLLHVDLPNLLKMSWIELEEGERSFSFRESHFPKCARSRLRRPDVEEQDGVLLTARDRKVLAEAK
jgi:isoleucyl-tRNA synthetase